MGLVELRRELSKYVEKTFDVSYDAEKEILITVGVSEALDIALRALINPGDEVLYHEPCYVSYKADVIFAHGVPLTVETRMEDGFRLTRAMLEKKITPRTKILLLNFPNNPTGAILPEKEVREIAEFAKEHNLIVITDEIYAEMTYDGRHVSIAAMPGMKERTIFLHGFSKAWAMTGFRLGYACGPSEFTEAMMKVHQYTMLCAPTPSQKAAVEALTNPERDIGVMTAEYQKRRNLLVSAFGEMGLPCARPAGAFYAFPCIRQLGIKSKDFALRLLDEENVAVVPGTAFGDCGEGFVRCAYATSMDNLKEALKRIAQFVKRLEG
jgi:aminotransferase